MFVPIIVSAVVYFLCSVAIAFGIARYAKARGKKPQRWGLGVLLIAFLIPFWDLLPTIVTHEYYCSTEAGFWVNKSVDQWKSENPGVYETLSPTPYARTVKVPEGYMVRINQRFLSVFSMEGPLLFNRWRREAKIIDEKTNEVIAREVDFLTAQERPMADWVGWKFWLHSARCSQVNHRDQGTLGGVEMQLQGLKK